MNKKYERYIEFIVSDIKPPYYENMREIYGVSEKEYPLVLSKIFNGPITIIVTIRNNSVYDANGNLIYREKDNGFWVKKEYNTNGNEIYSENSNGFWYKKEYDDQGNKIYYEDSYGVIRDNR